MSRLLGGTVGPQDALRYGRDARRTPAHLLHFTREKKPVVVWNVTRRCNLHCAHCYSDSHDRSYPGELTTLESRRLIDDLAAFGVPTVLFSGGEPLMRADLLELAGAAREAGLRTVLSTNGTLLDSSAMRDVAAAGFSYVGISVDGIGALHDKMRGERGAFDAALDGVRAVREAGVRVGLRFTLHARNRAELGDVFELAEREGVDRLCIYHLAQSGRAQRLKGFDLGPGATREAVEEIFDRVEDLSRRGVGLEVLTVDNPADNVLLLLRLRRTDPDRAADVEQLLRWNGGNQSGIAVACIDPVGKVHPDQFSWDVTVGNVRGLRFDEIWSDSNPLLARYRRRPRRLRGRCASCRFYALCNGGLRARAMSATGDFSAPDPACYLSDREIAA